MEASGRSCRGPARWESLSGGIGDFRSPEQPLSGRLPGRLMGDMLRSLLAVIVLTAFTLPAQGVVVDDGDGAIPGATAQRKIPLVFVGEWRATILESAGDYGQWYRPGDTTDVLISRFGILRTLDGGGGQIHFLLHVPAKEAEGKPVTVEAIRHLPFLGKNGMDEHVTITDREGQLEIVVEIEGVGRMRMELAQILPRGVG